MIKVNIDHFRIYNFIDRYLIWNLIDEFIEGFITKLCEWIKIYS